jgi:hypothetical protein
VVAPLQRRRSHKLRAVVEDSDLLKRPPEAPSKRWRRLQLRSPKWTTATGGGAPRSRNGTRRGRTGTQSWSGREGVFDAFTIKGTLLRHLLIDVCISVGGLAVFVAVLSSRSDDGLDKADGIGPVAL